MSKRTFWRVVIFEFIIFISNILFIRFTNWTKFDRKDQILETIIAIISIITAIIVTYLFSKLFSEKAILIDRKKEIDKLAGKITLLRRLSFQIRSMHEFWKFKNEHININIKTTIDYKYSELTYEEYRGYSGNGNREFSEKERKIIDKDISGTDGQAYLALKGLQDDENIYNMFDGFNPQNYSLQDIQRYSEYAGSFWFFLDRSDRVIFDFNRVNRYHLNEVSKLYFRITNKSIDQKEYRSELMDLFNCFIVEIFPKHYYLTSMNSNNFNKLFRSSFLNLLLFIALLISTIILYIIEMTPKFNYISTLIIISLFIANTVDLVIITYNSIVEEMNVSDFFEL